jgi:uncharacterized membrane protein YbjE (DUF340 family)
MLDMLNLMISLIIGILLGLLLREKQHFDLSKVTFAAVVVLIFSMGFTIGSNNDLLASMQSIGVNAIIILLLSIFFSVAFVKLARRVVKLE